MVKVSSSRRRGGRKARKNADLATAEDDGGDGDISVDGEGDSSGSFGGSFEGDNAGEEAGDSDGNDDAGDAGDGDVIGDDIGDGIGDGFGDGIDDDIGDGIGLNFGDGSNDGDDGSSGDGSGDGSFDWGSYDWSSSSCASLSVEPHRHDGVYLARRKDDAIQLLTRSLAPGDNVYGELLLSADCHGESGEYRTWSPFLSKLAAAVLGGVDNLHISEGSRVLFLGAGYGRTVSHIADIVGEEGQVYAVERDSWASRGLLELANKRDNIVPIIEDAVLPYKYHQIVAGSVDTIYCDVQHEQQVRVLKLNVCHFLKKDGYFLMMLRAQAIDGEVAPELAYASVANKLKAEDMEPLEQISLEPYVRGHAVVVGVHKPRRPQLDGNDGQV